MSLLLSADKRSQTINRGDSIVQQGVCEIKIRPKESLRLQNDHGDDADASSTKGSAPLILTRTQKPNNGFLDILHAMPAPVFQESTTSSRDRLFTPKIVLWLFASLLACGLSGLCVYFPWALIATKTPVINVTDRSVLERREFPGFVWQDPNSPRLLLMKRQLSGIVSANASGIEKATAIRRWCRDQQVGTWGAVDDSSEDPLLLLDRQRKGIPGACRRFAFVLAGALMAGGLDARVVGISAGLYDRDATHTLVEVWIPELGHWVLIDSMFDVTYQVDGKPASLLQVYDAAHTGIGRITFERDGSNVQPLPSMKLNKQILQHLLYLRTNAYFDGYRVSVFGRKRISVAHYASYGGSQYPEALKETLLAGSICFLGLGALGMLFVVWRIVFVYRVGSRHSWYRASGTSG